MNTPTMLAARFHAGREGVTLEHVDLPRPGAGQVLVEVAACGICASDVHMIGGALPPVLPVVIPGHESSGTIAELGDGVPDVLAIGQHVAVSPGRRCGSCRNCVRGKTSVDCLDVQTMGSSYDGAWAEYVLVDYAQLVPIPDDLPFPETAILSDAVTTPYSALKDTAKLRVGESVGIWGLGGLGTHAVQLARLMGAAPVVAIDIDPVARERALRLGADVALDPRDETFTKQLLAVTDGRGLDVAVDFVGFTTVRAQVIASLAPAGKASSQTTNARAVLVGLTRDPLEVSESLPFIAKAQSVLGHYGGNSGHLEELVSLVRHGRLDVSGSVTRTYPLSEINEALDSITRGEDSPVRVVLVP